MGVLGIRLIGLAYACLVFSTLAAMAGEHHWLLELFSHFRVQYLAGLLLLLAVMASFGRWILAGLVLPFLVLNGLPLLPYVVAEAEAASETTRLSLTLATINLRARNEDGQRLLALVDAERPDVIVLQELTPRWADRIEPLMERYRHSLLVPRDGAFGIALLSIYPLARQQVFALSGLSYPTISATVQVGATQLNLIGVHPISPTSSTSAGRRNDQLNTLAIVAAQTDGALAVLGDFNATPWSPHLQKFLIETGLRNAAEGFGLDFTWPTFLPLLGIPIDHCLVSSELAVNGYHRGRSIGSDHYPVFIEVAL